MKSSLSFFQGLVLTCLIGILTLGLLFLSNANKIQKINKAEFFYKMDHDFFISDSGSNGLIKAMGNKTPILIKNGGRFDDYDIDDYLAYFEMIKNYMDDDIVSEKYVYNSYSFYIIQAYQNKEIHEYIESWRKESNDSTYYRNFEIMAKRFIEKH